MSENTSSTTNKIVRAYQDYLGDNLLAMVLYGSRARGEAGEASDYDIYVVTKELPEKPLERAEFLHRPRVSIKEDVSVRGKTRAEFESSLMPLYLDLAIDGKILYDTDGYMEGKLRRIREIIKEAGLSRIRKEGELMWVWNRPVRPGWELEWEGLIEVA